MFTCVFCVVCFYVIILARRKARTEVVAKRIPEIAESIDQALPSALGKAEVSEGAAAVPWRAWESRAQNLARGVRAEDLPEDPPWLKSK